jgi:hypothetical protein
VKKFSKIFESNTEEIDIRNVFSDMIDNHGFEIKYDSVYNGDTKIAYCFYYMNGGEVDVSNIRTSTSRKTAEMGLHDKYYEYQKIFLTRPTEISNDISILKDFTQALERLDSQYDRIEYTIANAKISIVLIKVVNNSRFQATTDHIKKFLERVKSLNETRFEIEVLEIDEPNHKLFNVIYKGESIDVNSVLKVLGTEAEPFEPGTRTSLAANRKSQSNFNIGDKEAYTPFTIRKYSPYFNRETDDIELKFTCAVKWKDDYLKVFDLLI